MIARLLKHVGNDSQSLSRKLRREFGGTFDEHKAIFIHIPKAAGTSIALAMFGHQVSHNSIMHYYRLDYEKAAEYFKFTFVREPFTRALSAYRYLAAGGMNAYDREFARRYIKGLSLAKVVEQLAKEPDLMDSMHFRPQYRFVTDPQQPRTLLVNYVGHVETLADDIKPIMRRLNRDVEVPRLNPSPNPTPIRDAEYAELRDTIYRLYEHDYELFGYPRS